MYQPLVAEKLFDNHSNVVYTRVGRDMVVTAKDAITTSPNNATELALNWHLQCATMLAWDTIASWSRVFSGYFSLRFQQCHLENGANI